MTVADFKDKPTMTRTARATLWACAPLMLLVGWFLFIAAINWDYQVKFFQPVLIGGRSDAWLGLKLLGASVVFGVVSSAFAFLASRQVAEGDRFYAVLSLFVSLLLFLMGLGFLVLGPAAITMMEQMNNVRP